MPAAVKLREDFSAQELRALARRAKDVNQSRRLLSLAAVRDGKDRAEAAQIGGMDSADAARLGSSLQRRRAGRPFRPMDGRPQAAVVGGAADRTRKPRRGWAGSRERRRCAFPIPTCT